MTDLLTDYLPKVRCAPEMKRRLEAIADHSVTRELADHIRFAVERYIAEQWREEYEADLFPMFEPEIVK
jgi:predicted DNA-binding protein